MTSEYTQPDGHDACFFLKDKRHDNYCTMYLELNEQPDGSLEVRMFSSFEEGGEPGIVAFTTQTEAINYVRATGKTHLKVEEKTLEERLDLFRFLHENNYSRFLVILGSGRNQEEFRGLDESANIPVTFLFLDELVKEAVVGKLNVDVKGKVDPGHTRIGKPT